MKMNWRSYETELITSSILMEPQVISPSHYSLNIYLKDTMAPLIAIPKEHNAPISHTIDRAVDKPERYTIECANRLTTKMV